MDKTLSLSAIRSLKNELGREAERLRARLAALNAEMAELEAAENLVARLGKDVIERGSLREPQMVYQLKPPGSRVISLITGSGKTLTTKDLILRVMGEVADPWTNANDIQTRVSEIKGREVPMSTISPTLSDLKKDELIVRDGMKIALADRVKENEPPKGKPEDGSETALAAQ